MRLLLVTIQFFLYFCRPLLTNTFPKMDTKSFIQTKKPYAKPIMLAERFVANEYVASCSIQGVPIGSAIGGESGRENRGSGETGSGRRRASHGRRTR